MLLTFVLVLPVRTLITPSGFNKVVLGVVYLGDQVLAPCDICGMPSVDLCLRSSVPLLTIRYPHLPQAVGYKRVLLAIDLLLIYECL
jgi:hypothetical protein